MKFEKVVSHMGKKGFVTRKSWNGRLVLCFGMDNVIHAFGDDRTHYSFSFSLADFLGDDWIILPYFRDGSEYDFLPYEKKDKLLVRLKLTWEKECQKMIGSDFYAKIRPKSADYMGPPGGKTPLGVKIPQLSKKEKQIGKSLESKARKLLRK